MVSVDDLIVRLKMRSIVHIVESPRSKELLDGSTEGHALSSVLELHGIECDLATAIDKESLKLWALSVGNQVQEDGYRPVLHFSCHGSSEDIELTSGEEIEWPELREIFAPIIDVSNNQTILCMSSCYGRSAYKVSKKILQDVDYCIGPIGEVYWPDSLVAYSSFYHNFLSKNGQFNDAIIRMNSSIGAQDLIFGGFSALEIGKRIVAAEARDFLLDKLEKLQNA